MEKTDEEIVTLVQKGDVQSFGVLIERFEKKLSRYASKFISSSDDVKDIIQDVFLKAYTNIKSFNTNLKFSPWVYRIAHNEIVNSMKKKKRRQVEFTDMDTLLPHFKDNNIEDDLSDKEAREALNNSLEKLDIKYQEPLFLHYYEDFGYEDIAEVLRIPVSTVGVRIMRGKKELRKIMKEK